jgi:hypothetical protein
LEGVQTSGRLWKHARLSDIYGLVGQQEIEEFFTFTLVRNPWDRLVSYYHWLRAQAFDHPAVRLAQRCDFPGFLDHPRTRASLAAAPYGSYMLDRGGVERCNAFIRLEHLDEDLAPLAAHLGFRPEMGRANASERQVDYRGYYTDSLASLVAQICAPDIERFGYKF